jgi:hypothetical protein
MEKLKPCNLCNVIPEIECGCDDEGNGVFWIEHECNYGLVEISICDDNRFSVIRFWNKLQGEKEKD